MGVGGRWEAEVDVLFTVFTVACTICSVEFEIGGGMGGGMGRLVSSV